VVADPHPFVSETFGPVSVVVEYDDPGQLVDALSVVEGSLTGTIHAAAGDDPGPVLDVLTDRCGRIVWNGWPTGVAVAWATHHGGPWPATTLTSATSVGADAVQRWLRPVCFQDVPLSHLPSALRDPGGAPARGRAAHRTRPPHDRP
jgi:NADP-dependent aldehyde dehydrogenase